MNAYRFLILCLVATGVLPASGQILEKLEAFNQRIKVDDPSVTARRGREGPKDIVSADFNQDGKVDFATSNLDGTVTVVFGVDGGKFAEPIFLQTGGTSLRGLHAVDLDRNNWMDLVTLDPFDGKMYTFFNNEGTFAEAVSQDHWVGVRAISSGDFNGDAKPDLVLAGPGDPGLRVILGDGAGGVMEAITPQFAIQISAEDSYPSRPAHSIAVFRPPGESLDGFIVSNAESSLIWTYISKMENGEFSIVREAQRSVSVKEPIQIQTGSLLGMGNSSLDLAVVSKETGKVTIIPSKEHTVESPGYWDSLAAQSLSVPGAPRALEIVDMNNDGWNDLVVALRGYDRVVVFENKETHFELVSEMPSGSSPREVLAVNINNDDLPDLLVMNRSSQDVSVLRSNVESGFIGVADNIYPVDGQVVGIAVRDLNGDERDDVIQVHSVTDEVSVRLTALDGSLSDPVCYSVGGRPVDFSLDDLDKDGHIDIAVTNLGGNGVSSSLGILFGNGDGTFRPLLSIPENNGRMFALEIADFDGDGLKDFAIGYYDCRVVFYRAVAEGDYIRASEHRFTYESRAMIAQDFDQDGDLDLAGTGAVGDVVVFVNNGDFFSPSITERYDYDLDTRYKIRPTISASKVNEDEDLDLIVSTASGFEVLLGGEGATFTLAPEEQVDLPVSPDDAMLVDFDGDGRSDLVSTCYRASCVSLHRGVDEGFEHVLTVDVPSAQFIATGDIDDDGLTDLVGTGSFLWVVLSSTTPKPAAKQILSAELRPKMTHPVINEIISNNDTLAVPGTTGGNLDPDIVELYHGGDSPADISQWILRLVTDQGTKDYRLPANTLMAPSSRLILFCDDEALPYYTGFKLPREGGSLTLINGATEIDSVTYPEMPSDTSWSRFQDGSATFSLNGIPDPGRQNLDNGAVDPSIDFDGFPASSFGSRDVLKVQVQASDDFGIFSLTMNYRILGPAEPEEKSLLLYDDGMHGDGLLGDDIFANEIAIADLPEGAEIEFFFTAVDLTGEQTSEPGTSYFTSVDIPTEHHKIRLGASLPGVAGLQISEVVTRNLNGIVEENGRTSDWVEVRNTSEDPISLAGMHLTRKLFEDAEETYDFPTDTSLQPGEYFIIFADNDPQDGPQHAPYRLDADGETLFLISKDEDGVESVLSYLEAPAIAPDTSVSRIGNEEDFIVGSPTPAAANGRAGVNLIEREDDFLLFFPTRPGLQYVFESSGSLAPDGWGQIFNIPGTGIEQTYIESKQAKPKQFYRLFTQ